MSLHLGKLHKNNYDIVKFVALILTVWLSTGVKINMITKHTSILQVKDRTLSMTMIFCDIFMRGGSHLVRKMVVINWFFCLFFSYFSLNYTFFVFKWHRKAAILFPFPLWNYHLYFLIASTQNRHCKKMEFKNWKVRNGNTVQWWWIPCLRWIKRTPVQVGDVRPVEWHSA